MIESKIMKTTKLNSNGYQNGKGIQQKETDTKRLSVKPIQLIQKIGTFFQTKDFDLLSYKGQPNPLI